MAEWETSTGKRGLKGLETLETNFRDFASRCYDEFVRTTIDLAPEAWHLAKAIARERNQSLGKVVSEFILRPPGVAAAPPTHSAAGFPVFASGKTITSDDVQALLDEDSDVS
jgi:hypothetical protein